MNVILRRSKFSIACGILFPGACVCLPIAAGGFNLAGLAFALFGLVLIPVFNQQRLCLIDGTVTYRATLLTKTCQIEEVAAVEMVLSLYPSSGVKDPVLRPRRRVAGRPNPSRRVAGR